MMGPHQTHHLELLPLNHCFSSKPEPVGPFRPRFRRLARHRIRLDHPSTLSLDRTQSPSQSNLCDAPLTIVPIHEETRDPPQLLRVVLQVHPSIISSAVDSREFLLQSVGAPADRILTVVEKNSVCAAIVNQQLLVKLVLSPPPCGRQSLHRSTMGTLIVHAPATSHSSMLREQSLEVWPSGGTQLSSCVSGLARQ